MLSDQFEAQLAEKRGKPARMGSIDGKFDKGDVRNFSPIGQRGRWLILLAAEQHQRAHGIDCDICGRLGAKLVVEDFKRQRSVVAGRSDSSHELRNREIALPRKTAEVTAPGQNIEIELRRIRKLDQEYPVARDRGDGRNGKPGRERMETVEDQPD